MDPKGVDLSAVDPSPFADPSPLVDPSPLAVDEFKADSRIPLQLTAVRMMKLQLTKGAYTYTFQKQKLVEYFLQRASAIQGEPVDEFFYRFLYCPATGRFANRFPFYSRGRRVLALEGPYSQCHENEIWCASLEDTLLQFRQWFLERSSASTSATHPLLSEEYLREACHAAAHSRDDIPSPISIRNG